MAIWSLGNRRTQGRAPKSNSDGAASGRRLARPGPALLDLPCARHGTGPRAGVKWARRAHNKCARDSAARTRSRHRAGRAARAEIALMTALDAAISVPTRRWLLASRRVALRRTGSSVPSRQCHARGSPSGPRPGWGSSIIDRWRFVAPQLTRRGPSGSRAVGGDGGVGGGGGSPR